MWCTVDRLRPERQLPRVQLTQVLRRESRQRLARQLGPRNMRAHVLAVVADRPRLEVGGRQAVEPALEVGAKRQLLVGRNPAILDRPLRLPQPQPDVLLGAPVEVPARRVRKLETGDPPSVAPLKDRALAGVAATLSDGARVPGQPLTG